jgi:DNA-binding MarR family transcriptional regulator
METLQYPELTKSVPYQLWRASNRWQRTMRRALEPIGVTYVQSVVLLVVKFLGERHPYVTQAMVARTADIDEMMTSQVVRALESQYLLERTEHPQDARARCLRLTAEGENQAGRCQDLSQAVAEELLQPIGPRRQDLVEMLRILATESED